MSYQTETSVFEATPANSEDISDRIADGHTAAYVGAQVVLQKRVHAAAVYAAANAAEFAGGIRDVDLLDETITGSFLDPFLSPRAVAWLVARGYKSPEAVLAMSPDALASVPAVTTGKAYAALKVGQAYQPRAYTVALLSLTNTGDSPHDNNVVGEYRRSRGSDVDAVERILMTNSKTDPGGTEGETWHARFGYTAEGYEQLAAYLVAGGFSVVFVPYGDQDNAFFRYHFAPILAAGIELVVASGQTGRDFSWYAEPRATDLVFLTSASATNDVGNGVELKVVPPDQGTFTNPNTLSQTIGCYAGAWVRAADEVTKGDFEAARLVLRSLATPDAGGYSKAVGHGTLNYSPSLDLL